MGKPCSIQWQTYSLPPVLKCQQSGVPADASEWGPLFPRLSVAGQVEQDTWLAGYLFNLLVLCWHAADILVWHSLAVELCGLNFVVEGVFGWVGGVEVVVVVGGGGGGGAGCEWVPGVGRASVYMSLGTVADYPKIPLAKYPPLLCTGIQSLPFFVWHDISVITAHQRTYIAIAINSSLTVEKPTFCPVNMCLGLSRNSRRLHCMHDEMKHHRNRPSQQLV